MLNFKLLYVWQLLDKILSTSDKTPYVKKFTALCEQSSLIERTIYQQCLQLFGYKFEETIYEELDPYLFDEKPYDKHFYDAVEKLKKRLDSFFSQEYGIVEETESYISSFNEALTILKKLSIKEFQPELLTVSHLLENISKYCLAKLLSQDLYAKPTYDIHLYWLYVQSVVDQLCLPNLTISNPNACQVFSELLFKITGIEITPLYLIHDSYPIEGVIDHNFFPDPVFSLLFDDNIFDHELAEKSSIIIKLNTFWVEDQLLSPLFAAQTAAFIDKKQLGLSNHILNQVISNTPQLYIWNRKTMTAWIQVMVKDLMAVSMMGFSYYCALLQKALNSPQEASDLQPDICFRLNLLYNYLYQQEYLCLLTANGFAKMQNSLSSLLSSVPTTTSNYKEIENALEPYYHEILTVTMDTLKTHDCHLSSQDVVKALSASNGIVSKALDRFPKEPTKLKDFAIKQNLLWLRELKKLNSTVFNAVEQKSALLS